MGTRADFYIKKADQTELVWLASIAWDGYPSGIDSPEVLKATTEEEYIKLLTEFLRPREDVTLPENGWPWPWDNSKTTDWAYCFHEGKVYGNCFGCGWIDPIAEDQNTDENEDYEPPVLWQHAYPDMKSIKNVRMDKGSGIILISVRK